MDKPVPPDVFAKSLQKLAAYVKEHAAEKPPAVVDAAVLINNTPPSAVSQAVPPPRDIMEPDTNPLRPKIRRVLMKNEVAFAQRLALSLDKLKEFSEDEVFAETVAKLGFSMESLFPLSRQRLKLDERGTRRTREEIDAICSRWEVDRMKRLALIIADYRDMASPALRKQRETLNAARAAAALRSRIMQEVVEELGGITGYDSPTSEDGRSSPSPPTGRRASFVGAILDGGGPQPSSGRRASFVGAMMDGPGPQLNSGRRASFVGGLSPRPGDGSGERDFLSDLAASLQQDPAGASRSLSRRRASHVGGDAHGGGYSSHEAAAAAAHAAASGEGEGGGTHPFQASPPIDSRTQWAIAAAAAAAAEVPSPPSSAGGCSIAERRRRALRNAPRRASDAGMRPYMYDDEEGGAGGGGGSPPRPPMPTNAQGLAPVVGTIRVKANEGPVDLLIDTSVVNVPIYPSSGRPLSSDGASVSPHAEGGGLGKRTKAAVHRSGPSTTFYDAEAEAETRRRGRRSSAVGLGPGGGGGYGGGRRASYVGGTVVENPFSGDGGVAPFARKASQDSSDYASAHWESDADDEDHAGGKGKAAARTGGGGGAVATTYRLREASNEDLLQAMEEKLSSFEEAGGGVHHITVYKPEPPAPLPMPTVQGPRDRSRTRSPAKGGAAATSSSPRSPRQPSPRASPRSDAAAETPAPQRFEVRLSKAAAVYTAPQPKSPRAALQLGGAREKAPAPGASSWVAVPLVKLGSPKAAPQAAAESPASPASPKA